MASFTREDFHFKSVRMVLHPSLWSDLGFHSMSTDAMLRLGSHMSFTPLWGPHMDHLNCSKWISSSLSVHYPLCAQSYGGADPH